MLADKQREVLIQEKGEPLRIEFDVFGNDDVSMWTHFNHGSNFQEIEQKLIAIRNHIDGFIKLKKMCPFYKEPKSDYTPSLPIGLQVMRPRYPSTEEYIKPE